MALYRGYQCSELHRCPIKRCMYCAWCCLARSCCMERPRCYVTQGSPHKLAVFACAFQSLPPSVESQQSALPLSQLSPFTAGTVVLVAATLQHFAWSRAFGRIDKHSSGHRHTRHHPHPAPHLWPSSPSRSCRRCSRMPSSLAFSTGRWPMAW